MCTPVDNAVRLNIYPVSMLENAAKGCERCNARGCDTCHSSGVVSTAVCEIVTAWRGAVGIVLQRAWHSVR